jgi:hypothetical protein
MSAPATLVSIKELVEVPDFDLSTRGKIDEIAIKSKIPVEFYPLIIDISIQGYSNKAEFELEKDGKKFSDFKKHTVKAAKDGTSLTIKRACRVMRYETQAYIYRKKLKTPLYRRFANAQIEKNSSGVAEYAFIGGEHFVPLELGEALIYLWSCFDKEKNTKISDSVRRVIEARS